MQFNTQYTKSECRLFDELVNHCVEDKNGEMFKMQYKIKMPENRHAILDIAIPELKICYRVMGEVHGMPFAMKPTDEIHLAYLKQLGWDVVDVWHTERPDLWK